MCCWTWAGKSGPSSPTSIVRASPLAGSWKKTGSFVAPDPGRLPQVGEVDDRELEALAAVDRQHLHRLGVGLQPAAALLVARLLLGGRDPLAQPAGQRGRPEPLGGGRRVQQLADVAQVGQPPLAVLQREQPPGQPLDERDRLQQRRDAAHAQHARPLVQAAVDLLPLLLAGARDPLGVPAEERRQRGGAGAGGRARALDRLQQPQPVARGLGAEHAARAVDDRGDLDRVERVAHERRLAVGAHEHRDVARPHRVLPEHRAVLGPALDPRAGGEQPDEVGGEVARDVAARGVVARVAVAGRLDRRVVAVHDAHPQRRGMRRAEQPRRPVGAARRARSGRRSPRGRAARRRTARRRPRAAPGRCAS